MRPIQAILALEVISDSLKCPICRNGIELSSEDRATVVEVYTHWCLLLLDLGYLHPLNFRRSIHAILSDMIARDVLILNGSFAELLSFVRMKEGKGFKGLCANISTHLYHLIRDDWRDVRDGNAIAAKRLVQLFSYTLRLSLRDIDLSQQCLESYRESESYIDDVYPEALIQSLREIITDWMKDFSPSNLKARHGPGGVADATRASIEDKYKLLKTDSLLEYAFGLPEWVEPGCTVKLDRTSRTIFVPKSYKTFRTISLEPSTLQYLQQGVWLEIDRLVSSNFYLRNHIGFHDQKRNQRLALLGSIDRNYATIDLSAASDSVSYVLVKKLFRKTKLLRFIVATRSRETVLPDGSRIELKKFAPMGSALCFPIETLIFASICEHVTRGHGVAGDFSVFGDDIIVPTQCVGDTVNILYQLGFRVNRDKSFSRQDTWFRESCGIECCDGYDVTPLRVSRKYASRTRDIQAQSLIDLANACYQRNFEFLRCFALHKLFKLRWKPLFGPTSLLSDDSTNYQLKVRWNFDLQRLECKSSRLVTRYGKTDETIRYRHWLESTNGRITPEADFKSETGSPTVFLRDVWTAKPYHPLDQEMIDAFVEQTRSRKPTSKPQGWKVVR